LYQTELDVDENPRAVSLIPITTMMVVIDIGMAMMGAIIPATIVMVVSKRPNRPDRHDKRDQPQKENRFLHPAIMSHRQECATKVLWMNEH
jgi:hypothetical protein